MELGPLAGVLLRRDFALHAEVEQGLELPLDLDPLALQLRLVLAVLFLAAVGLRPDHVHDPLADVRVLHPHPTEQLQKMPVHLLFPEPYPRMPRLLVVGAEVVHVRPHRAVRAVLELALPGEAVPAVAAGDRPAREGELGLLVDLARPAVLDRLEGRPVDQGREGAGVPLPLMTDLADVVAVAQDLVQGLLVELRGTVGEDHPLRC
ncbi:MAG TPA: hypothetical protein VHN77_14615 [Phycisphaerales bacterium]|nr:hypothetical protein [Phycisphaerales bacterium]